MFSDNTFGIIDISPYDSQTFIRITEREKLANNDTILIDNGFSLHWKEIKINENNGLITL